MRRNPISENLSVVYKGKFRIGDNVWAVQMSDSNVEYEVVGPVTISVINCSLTSAKGNKPPILEAYDFRFVGGKSYHEYFYDDVFSTKGAATREANSRMRISAERFTTALNPQVENPENEGEP
ncbi:MAG: hypothetical protein WC824_10760 [Bacteroidota bacterium]|jgi:hypothetical protein